MSNRHRPPVPPHHKRRQWLARVMVVVAAVALTATSRAESELAERVSTDVPIAEPARFAVKVLLNEAATTGDVDIGPLLRIDATGYYPAGTLAETADRLLPDVSVTVTPLLEDGTRLDPADGSRVEHPAGCPRDEPCVLRYEVRVAMANDAHHSARAGVSLEGYVEYEQGGFLLGGPTIPEGARLDIQVTDAEGRAVEEGATGDRPEALETLEMTVGERDLPGTRMVFVRSTDASASPIAVRTGSNPNDRVQLVPVVDGLASQGGHLTASGEQPLAFRPFEDCAAGTPCLREFALRSGSSGRETVFLTLPEGVRIEPGSLTAPALDGMRVVPEDDVISTTVEGRIELPQGGFARRSQVLHLSPQDAPTYVTPWLSAVLEVDVDAPSDTTVVATLSGAHRQLGGDLPSSSVGTWFRGNLVPSSQEDGPSPPDDGSTEVVRGGYQAQLPIRFEATGPATITWRLTVRLDAAGMLLPEGAEPQLVPFATPSASPGR